MPAGDEARERLRSVICLHGVLICEDHARCERTLQERCCGASELHLNAISAVLRSGAVQALLQLPSGAPVGLAVAAQAARVTREQGLDAGLARWALEAWAEALGLAVAGPAGAAGPGVAVRGLAGTSGPAVAAPDGSVSLGPAVAVSGLAGTAGLGVTAPDGSVSSGLAVAVRGLAGAAVPGVTVPDGSVSSGPGVAVRGLAGAAAPGVTVPDGSMSLGLAVAVSGLAGTAVPGVTVPDGSMSLGLAVAVPDGSVSLGLAVAVPDGSVSLGPAAAVSGLAGTAVPGVAVPDGSVSLGLAVAVPGLAGTSGLAVAVPDGSVSSALAAAPDGSVLSGLGVAVSGLAGTAVPGVAVPDGSVSLGLAVAVPGLAGTSGLAVAVPDGSVSSALAAAPDGSMSLGLAVAVPGLADTAGQGVAVSDGSVSSGPAAAVSGLAGTAVPGVAVPDGSVSLGLAVTVPGLAGAAVPGVAATGPPFRAGRAVWALRGTLGAEWARVGPAFSGAHPALAAGYGCAALYLARAWAAPALITAFAAAALALAGCGWRADRNTPRSVRPALRGGAIAAALAGLLLPLSYPTWAEMARTGVRGPLMALCACSALLLAALAGCLVGTRQAGDRWAALFAAMAAVAIGARLPEQEHTVWSMAGRWLWPPGVGYTGPATVPPPSGAWGEGWTNPVDGSELVYVPAGEFTMGSDTGEPDAQPQRRVYMDGYWIGKTPVTVAQYRRFCAATGRAMPSAPPWGWREDHPMVNVSWDDAKSYCDRAGLALPTEAQWEKAARGTDGRAYPWGSVWDPAKVGCSAAPASVLSAAPVGSWPAAPLSTEPVGSRPAGASPYGCLDMEGSVHQWCADPADPYGGPSAAGSYADLPRRNPIGEAPREHRALRGGSWDLVVTDLFHAAHRYYGFASNRRPYDGFRVVTRPGSR